MHFTVQAFFMSAYHSTNLDIGIRVPPCTGLMAVQHSVDCVEQRDRHGCFFIIMLHKSTISNAAMLGSLGTSAHETGFSVADLYTEFARLGMTLHGCRIRILGRPNKNGATITGVFNISGTGYTMGATSLPELIDRVHAKWLEKQAYYRECRHRKNLEREQRRRSRVSCEIAG